MVVTAHHKELADQAGIGISEAKLRGRQSVRTTFRLPVHLIELLGIIAGQFGVKQKSLFDQMIESDDVLDEVAEWVADYTPGNIERRPKTYVLSKRSLLALERIAAERQVSRDILVEISIRRLLPLLITEREKHSKRVKILGEMEKYQRKGHELLAKAGKLLDIDDPVYEMISRMVYLGEEKVMSLTETVAKGKILEKVNIGKFLGGAINGR
ncbi:MAG: hypothetical protein KJ630_04370 [Proteobacteria bacterium]|nr:hypothetical protein [Pseudomonadota bacterium]